MKIYIALITTYLSLPIFCEAQTLGATLNVGIGTDFSVLNKFAPIANISYPVQSYGNMPFELTEPLFYGLTLNYAFNKNWQIESGFSIIERRILAYTISPTSQIFVFPNSRSYYDTKLDFSTRQIPLHLKVALNPNADKNQWALGAKVGIICEWTGSGRNGWYLGSPTWSQQAGPYAIMPYDTNAYNVFVRHDTEEFGLATSFGLSADKILKYNDKIGFDISFNHQLFTMTELAIWNYDKVKNQFSNGVGYNFQFNTLIFAVHYSLPWQVRFSKKEKTNTE